MPTVIFKSANVVRSVLFCSEADSILSLLGPQSAISCLSGLTLVQESTHICTHRLKKEILKQTEKKVIMRNKGDKRKYKMLQAASSSQMLIHPPLPPAPSLGLS